MATLAFYLQWVFWWIDVVLHILGGLWIGLALFWLFFLSGKVRVPNSSLVSVFLYVVLGTLIIGVGWEMFEYISGTFITEEMFPDTIHDLFADFAGALIAYTYAIAHKLHKLHNAEESDY